jgi:hypothetical protein
MKCAVVLFAKLYKPLHQSGEFVYVGHPSVDSEETRAWGKYNAYKRNADMEFVCAEKTLRLCREYGVRLLRYDEADAMLIPIAKEQL